MPTTREELRRSFDELYACEPNVSFAIVQGYLEDVSMSDEEIVERLQVTRQRFVSWCRLYFFMERNARVLKRQNFLKNDLSDGSLAARIGQRACDSGLSVERVLKLNGKTSHKRWLTISGKKCRLHELRHAWRSQVAYGNQEYSCLQLMRSQLQDSDFEIVERWMVGSTDPEVFVYPSEEILRKYPVAQIITIAIPYNDVASLSKMKARNYLNAWHSITKVTTPLAS